jgi:hypothetical protein
MHLKAGRSQVAFFAVFNREGEPHRLTRLLSAQSLIYKVTGASGRTHHLGERVDRHVRFEEGILVGPTSEPLIHDQKRLVGSLADFSLSAGGVLYVRGWIADRAKWKEATAYLIVSGVDRLLARPAVFRPDLSAGIRNSGFESFLQLGDADTDIKNVRLFVIFDDSYYAEMRHELRVMQ